MGMGMQVLWLITSFMTQAALVAYANMMIKTEVPTPRGAEKLISEMLLLIMLFDGTKVLEDGLLEIIGLPPLPVRKAW